MVYRSIISTLCLVLPAALAHHSTAYDYIIVGGGTAGLTLASRLTEDSKVTVCVLEAGGDGVGNPNITDLRNRYLPFGTPIDWALDTLPQKSAGGRVYTHRQGKVLGGSSAINGAVYLRPDVREYTAMEALGAKGWTWDKFLPYYKKGEAFTVDSDPLLDGLDPSYSGTDGPVQVSFASNISDFFASYAIPSIRAMNGTLNPDNSDGTPVGATPQQLTAYPGTYNRSYSANAYYFPVMRRSNLVVHTDSLVSRIIWDHDSHGLSVASGVEYLSSDGTNNTVLGKNVLVSAGTLNTPKVLELSGIGDPSLLSNLGIRVKVNNSGVGKNLQNQLGVNVIYALRNDTNVTAGAETQAPLIALLTAQNVLSKDDLAISDSLLQVKNDGISQAQFDTLKKYISHGIAQTEMDWSLVKGTDGSLSLQFYTTDLHTFSRGYSHANSTDPTAPVTLDPQYLSSQHDLWYLSRAVAYTRNITASEPLASIIASETTPGASYNTSDSLQEWLLPNFKTMSHFVGTSAALSREAGGVVDPETLIVYGTSNVRVIDASVIPILPGIHTSSIVYSIAEWAADMLKGKC